MDSLVALPVAIPLLAAAMFVAVRVFVPLRIYELAGIGVAAATSVVSAVILAGTRDELLVHWFGGWEPREGVAVGISFAADPFGAGLALLASVLVTAALVFSWHFYEDAGPLYPILMLLFLGGMTGFALSGDLFNMFVFFELMGVAAYALTAYRIEDVGPIQGAINFAVTNSIGGVLLLAGTALLYGRTGALNLAQLGEAVDGTAGGVLVVAFLLVAVGFLVKAAVVPFHFWLADAYAVAPLPVCAVLAGVMSDLGVYGIARVYWTVFEGSLGPHEAGLRALLVAVGVLSALVGAVMCFLQRHLKRLLAYSTISDVGVFLAGIGLLQPKALAGVGLYVVAHGLLKGALFLVAGTLLERFDRIDELHLHGRGRGLRLEGAIFLAGALGLAGLPPVGLFLGHSLLEKGANAVGYGWLNPVVWIASVVVAAAMLRAWARIFLGAGPKRDPLLSPEPEESEEQIAGEKRSAAVLLTPAALLVAAGLAISLVPGLASGAERAAERFQDRPAYASTVLHGSASPLPEEPPAHHAPLSSVLYGAGAVAGAAALAALVLIRPRGGLVPAPLLSALRAVHSGHIGDYVAWLVFGTAAIGGLLAFFVR